MRIVLGLALVTWILVLSTLSPVQAGSTTQTCADRNECNILKALCHKGSYGEVHYPDGSVWGICVI